MTTQPTIPPPAPPPAPEYPTSTTWVDPGPTFPGGPGCKVAEGHPSCVPGQLGELWDRFTAVAGWADVRPLVLVLAVLSTAVASVVWVQFVREDTRKARKVERERRHSDISYAGEERRIRKTARLAKTWPFAAAAPWGLLVLWLVGSGLGFGWLVTVAVLAVLVRRRWCRVAAGGR